MTEEILTVVISLLAVYGLCGLCMRIVTWLAQKQKNPLPLFP